MVLYKEIFNDKAYLRRLMTVALPLILQQMITYSVNLLDTMMIGTFGNAPLAAVNLVNQFYMIFSMLVFGTVSGGNVLNAQFWGRRDTKNIHRVMGLQIIFGAIVGVVFFVLTQTLPTEILRFYSKDEAVIQAGAAYLRIVAISFLVFPIGQFYSGALRSTGNTRIPMIVSAITLSLNALLNYLLIFGKLGLPALGLTGAAIATVIARIAETGLYLTITYQRKLPTAARPKDMLTFNKSLIVMIMKTGAPVILNETMWSLGTNAYVTTYSGISTASIAAYSAVSPVDNIAQALFFGVGDACAVIIGNLLGAGALDQAKRYAKYTLCLSISTAVLVGLLLYGLHTPILSLNALSDEAPQLAATLMTVVAFTLWLRTTNYTIIIGILRPGGQAPYCLLWETIIMWGIGIPLARLLAVRFGLPVYFAYFGTVTEEAVKLIVFYRRYRSGRWVVTL